MGYPVAIAVLARWGRGDQASTLPDPTPPAHSTGGASVLSLGVPEQDRLVDEGYNPSYGARPLRRAIMRLLEDSMAERMLSGEIKEGDSVIIDVDADGQVGSETRCLLPSPATGCGPGCYGTRPRRTCLVWGCYLVLRGVGDGLWHVQSAMFCFTTWLLGYLVMGVVRKHCCSLGFS